MTDLDVQMNRISRRSLLRGSLAAALLANPALARAASAALAGDVAADWPAVAELIRRYVAQRKLPGMIATLGWGKAEPRVLTMGSHAFDGAQPVGLDSLYRIYSMTKPVTGLVAATLIAEGKLSLETRLADVFPQFAAMRVAIDPKKGLESRPATVPITVRHLLTHTAGFGYGGIGQDKASAELARNGLIAGVISRKPIPVFTSPVPVPGPDEFLRRAAAVPLVAEPGTAWRYSMALDILGLMMARMTGKSLGALIQERIFGPAGMTSTRFQLREADKARLTTNYGILGSLTVPIDGPADTIFTDPTAFEFGGAGLVSTPRDFDRFMQLLLNDGKLGNRRVVDPAAVRLAVSNLLPAGVSTKGTFSEGAGYGAGGRVGLGADEGSFGWSGAAGTVFFIQRRIGLRGALYTQFMPPEVYPLQREFLTAAREDVTPRPAKQAA
ncbi:serine hydrolase [Novosphingobium sp. TH158]|uniref:serine hydrolase domain-containing protein n=1 Tax=Novosphingobium sp. TH158 TaxID=2067455 RepID=UPI000C7D0E45|nr:serine hydrolase domain-containing protein [Novosphingobium sp. TH158]PLK26542.1 serine hydrolase [Novosphingobium sp. TH158]